MLILTLNNAQTVEYPEGRIQLTDGVLIINEVNVRTAMTPMGLAEVQEEVFTAAYAPGSWTKIEKKTKFSAELVLDEDDIVDAEVI